MKTPLAAEVLHVGPGRLRLRIAALLRRDAELAELAAAIGDLDPVAAVTFNPLTASLLVLHRGDGDAVTAEIERRAGLTFGPPPGLADVLPEVARGFARQRESIHRQTGVDLDPRTLAFYALLGIALVQLIRGNVVVPATTALWYATSLIPGADQPPDSA